MQKNIVFYLNGKRHQVSSEHSHLMLGEYLRNSLELTGTKIVCAEGDCGACTVLKSHGPADSSQFVSINSCIAPLGVLHATHILTVESLKDGDRLHESQRSMMECHGSQCGFCTPGFVMAYAGLCEQKITQKNFNISEQEIKNYTTGNLCRCTGYKDIINAGLNMKVSEEKSLLSRYHTSEVQKELSELHKTAVEVKSESVHLLVPTTLKEATDFLLKYPDCRIISSGTDLGVVHNKRKINLQHYLSPHLIQELYENKVSESSIYVGAKVTLSDLRRIVTDKIPEFQNYLDIFASPQIKNIATLIGNIANASPIGDTPPVMLVLNAKVHMISSSGNRVVPIDQFFLDYRKIDRKKDELICGVEFDIPKKSEKLKIFKTSIRKDLDISTMNLAVRWSGQNKVVSEIKIAAGGIAATPLRLKKMEAYLVGKSLDEANITKSLEIAHTEFNPISDVRSSAAYRRIVFKNLFRRAILQGENA